MDKKELQEILIKRINPDNVPTLHVNDLHVSNTIEEFFITFSQIVPPMDLDDGEEINEINAIAKAKFVVAPKFIKAMLDALTSNYDKYEKLLEG